MNEKEKKEYLEQYKKYKEKGVPFFPDTLFKDAIVTLGFFILLVALAFFLGAELEPRANPADTAYTPRPEWYFLFLMQMLKYFPGELEVVGVLVIPGVGLLILFFLPYLDRSAKRHPLNRPIVSIGTLLVLGAIIALTVMALTEAPPPAGEGAGDQTAQLYIENCAGCHGTTIEVPGWMNLHAIIAQGGHEGMPAWSGDLSTNEIDALVGFIIKPGGSALFTENCSECHDAPDLVAGNPFQLKDALDQGPEFPAHEGEGVLQWSEVLSPDDISVLLNFLIAPDGQRLFITNCSSCHGRIATFTSGEEELKETIAEGGMHLDMPGWQEQLQSSELDILAAYVVDPSGSQEGENLYEQNCQTCHNARIPSAIDLQSALEVITSGGAHEIMPVWGDVLTPDQLESLIGYILTASSGGPSLDEGQQFYAQYCASCHGSFGEGGINPARRDDIIPPISSAEYLQTRDDFTLFAIIAQGQPNFGMSPFGSAFGGPMEDGEVEAVVAYMRLWELDPPVEFPPEVSEVILSLSGAETFQQICSQCPGTNGEALTGPALKLTKLNAEEIYDSINIGHEETAMLAWGEILSSVQIQDLVDFIQSLAVEEPETAESSAVPSYTANVIPIFDAYCTFCHGIGGGWDSSTYENAINSGDHGPAVVPGDVENSLLAQTMLGTSDVVDVMPPNGLLDEEVIQVILDWIEAGAPEN
jgi:mono/diheme cytochrome c family protein